MALEKTLRGIVLCGLFALPFIALIISQSLFFPYITGKNFAFRIIVEVITGAYIALALIQPAYRPKRSLLLGAFTLFVVVVALADLFGVYPLKSFWSNYERMDGWVTLAHLFALFVVASATLNTAKLWRAFFNVELGAAALVALYAFMQFFGFASLAEGFSSLSRLDATFGNPIYLAVYMLFNIAIAALLFVHTKTENGSNKKPLLFFYGALVCVFTLLLFMTGTRGAMLGLIGGVGLGSMLLIFSDEVSKKISRAALVVIVALGILGAIFFLVRGQAWVQNIPVFSRLATISLTDNTTKARFYNWGMAWQGVKERPILGWGQEHYAIVFDKYYDPRMYGQEQWFDRVHNVVFDWLVAAGFLGLVSYLAIFACAFLCIFARGIFTAFERSILTGVLAGYFVHNLFVFDNILSYVLFTLVLAYIAWRAAAHNTSLWLPAVNQRFAWAVAALALIGVWGIAWYVNAGALAANRALLKGLSPQQAGITQNLEHFKTAIRRGSIGTQEAREQLVQAAVQVARLESVTPEVKRAFFETAAQEISLQAQASPLDARFPLFLGLLLNSYGDLENAAKALAKALELSPKKQTIMFELGANALARGKTDEALGYFKNAYELAPEFVDARINYAAAAIRVGRDALADELLAPIIESGQAGDPRITAAYVTRGRYDKVATIWEKRVQANPDDAAAYFTLAAAHYGAGNRSRAIAVLQEAGTRVPEVKKQADELIQQIRDGTVQFGN